MKKFKVTTLLLASVLFLGLGATTLSAADVKCGAGKCGDAKKEMPAMKCGAGKCGAQNVTPASKCGNGKSADAKKETPAMKCGAGKCGGQNVAPASKCGNGK
jgi:uncharacterized low-complexity protein